MHFFFWNSPVVRFDRNNWQRKCISRSSFVSLNNKHKMAAYKFRIAVYWHLFWKTYFLEQFEGVFHCLQMYVPSILFLSVRSWIKHNETAVRLLIDLYGPNRLSDSPGVRTQVLTGNDGLWLLTWLAWIFTITFLFFVLHPAMRWSSLPFRTRLENLLMLFVPRRFFSSSQLEHLSEPLCQKDSTSSPQKSE